MARHLGHMTQAPVMFGAMEIVGGEKMKDLEKASHYSLMLSPALMVPCTEG